MIPDYLFFSRGSRIDPAIGTAIPNNISCV